jgi:hypothetical protein
MQSIPHSRRSGSYYSYQSQSDYNPYGPYLQEELAHQYKITFNEFLNDILCYGLPLNSVNISQNNGIVSDKCFQTLLSKYREPVDQETDRYSPFIELANHIIGQLNINPNSRIRFCRNDPVNIKGSRAKPHVAAVLNKSLEAPERSDVENLMKHGPNQAPFEWSEVLLFFEFKLVEKSLEPRDTVTGDRRSSTFSSSFLYKTSIYGSSGPVGVKLSRRSTAFPIYVSHTMRGTHFPDSGPPLHFAFINPFGSSCGVKAKRQYPFFQPVVRIKEAEARQYCS